MKQGQRLVPQIIQAQGARCAEQQGNKVLVSPGCMVHQGLRRAHLVSFCSDPELSASGSTAVLLLVRGPAEVQSSSSVFALSKQATFLPALPLSVTETTQDVSVVCTSSSFGIAVGVSLNLLLEQSGMRTKSNNRTRCRWFHPACLKTSELLRAVRVCPALRILVSSECAHARADTAQKRSQASL
jgi:hypothetical protein